MIFEKRKLETKENYNSYTRSGCAVLARPRREDFSRQELARRAGPVLGPPGGGAVLLSVYGRTKDALASGGDEGRGRLRQASGSRQRAVIRRFPNGATRPP